MPGYLGGERTVEGACATLGRRAQASISTLLVAVVDVTSVGAAVRRPRAERPRRRTGSRFLTDAERPQGRFDRLAAFPRCGALRIGAAGVPTDASRAAKATLAERPRHVVARGAHGFGGRGGETGDDRLASGIDGDIAGLVRLAALVVGWIAVRVPGDPAVHGQPAVAGRGGGPASGRGPASTRGGGGGGVPASAVRPSRGGSLESDAQPRADAVRVATSKGKIGTRMAPEYMQLGCICIPARNELGLKERPERLRASRR